MNFTEEFQMEIDSWRNENSYNEGLHSLFAKKVDWTPWLKEHREWTETNQHGFGDRAFGWAWKLLVDQMPQTFDFLEIGVFKGQILSLVALIAKHAGKTANITGVTTLENTPDERCKYPPGNYREWINQIHERFQVPYPNLVVGQSNDQVVLATIGVMDFDCVYVDGNHDYGIVVQDLDNYSKRVRLGGFLVVDDASIGRLNIGSLWPGLEMVAQAVKDTLDKDERFKFLFCIGHLNCFLRVK